MTTERDLKAYDEGTTELKDLLGLEPDYLEQLEGRAQFFIDGGHHERAVMMLEMIEELDRTQKLPTLLAIDSLLALGRSDAAEEKVRGLLERGHVARHFHVGIERQLAARFRRSSRRRGRQQAQRELDGHGISPGPAD